jgi:beta-galactosidase
MNLGVQYYRAPFPEQRYWADDMARMKDSGLNTVQLWVLWAWVEAEVGRFRWDDYDRLMDLADANGLGVVLSAIAEIHPYWIHREAPGSEMVTSMGQKVVSSNRSEVHFGITPGGCADHPGVWDRMAGFLHAVTERYYQAPALRGWDAWNELRWSEQADGLVCYCPHTLRAFRQWLSDRYGGLDGLNAAWLRRYGCWDEVMPGKAPNRPYTEMMAFEHFLTWRACRHARARYDVMRAVDAFHPITVHGGNPSPLYGGSRENTALDRGNDWFFADELDGVGCSSFPKWFGIDDADFGMRVEFVKSAARHKRVWLSEVQGGRSTFGFNLMPSVDARSQQRWVWNGLACGADTILFWCWRDEVFGRESDGFGLAGTDGLAEQRLEAMRRTGRLLSEHAALLDAYCPLQPQVGVLFSPQSYYLHWAQDAGAHMPAGALTGYCRALVRSSVPYQVVEEEHLDALKDLRVLFMPRATALNEPAERVLADWVQGGGTLVCESECGAFDGRGIYSYEEDRFTARLSGCPEVGRRALTGETMSVHVDGQALALPVTQWLTPRRAASGTVLAEHVDGALVLDVPVGRGRMLMIGSYLGDAYRTHPSLDTERFLEWIARSAGCEPDIEVVKPARTIESFVYVKAGQTGGRKVVFVFFPAGVGEATLRFRDGFLSAGSLTDIIGGGAAAVEGGLCRVAANDWGINVLVEG